MTYLIDGTIDGIYTALYNSYLTKTAPSYVGANNIQLEIGCDTIEIISDKSKADRVFNKLKTLLTHSEIDKIYIALRSDDEARFFIIFKYLKKTIDTGKCISDKFSDLDVFIPCYKVG